ncbi:MAG: zinc ribbon domain-containing protein [Treponema sp.]|jgi:hypothetical protein|nr:zinc ribbon domain-containing protein [Treponema sp.]
MNTYLLDIVNRIVAEQGEDILAAPARLKPIFSDYAKSEYKEDRVAFGRCIEYGAYQELKKTYSADERQSVKATLADQISAKIGVDRPRCAEALDLLEAVIFKTVQQSTPAPSQAKLCSKCGKELQKEWASCPYCSTSATKVEMQTSSQRPTKNTEMPKNIKKLLLAAVIIPPSCLVVQIILGLILEYDHDFIGGFISDFIRAFLDPEFFVVVLPVLIISTILNVLGQRKNNRKMILAAGIVYLISFIITVISSAASSVLCFIVFAKMKKINKEQ